ncbi:hypothetical protein GCM10010862_51660 [Devosia nitrariae]|uniref:Uncharacterized protein n=1 Tax=Devosia nitrariae TaxID=2071872 RepID=A0ABQ5WDJ1_9HYPH|nr:hypothetical protein GCM10010862_51660 [Devosia nitrariae]
MSDCACTPVGSHAKVKANAATANARSDNITSSLQSPKYAPDVGAATGDDNVGRRQETIY